MSNSYFQFKKFTVWQDQCAMKVGTDGVLLGAWTDIGNSRRILDIGTGTGLIALMLAQRSKALIDAIDIDLDACQQARSNIAKSPFTDRIQVYHTPLSEYKPLTDEKYDRIVSNPPYFTETLKCPEDKRRIARHADTLTLPHLLERSRELLAPEGKLALILPYDHHDILMNQAEKESLFLYRETTVSSRSGLKPIRLLVELATYPTKEIGSSSLFLETEDHQYTDTFTTLVKDFYLKM